MADQATGKGMIAAGRGGRSPAGGDADRRPGDALFRTIVGAAIALGVLHAGLILWWGRGPVLGESPSLIPLLHGFMMLASVSVALLALGRYQVVRDAASYWVGAGFAAAGAAMILYILAWPGLAPGGRPIIGQLTGTRTWITMLALGVLAVASLAAALVRWPGGRALAGRRWIWSAAAWPVATVLAVGLIVAFESDLPELVREDGTFTPLETAVSVALLVLFAAGAAHSARRYLGSGDTIIGCVALMQVLLACGVLDTVVCGRRYDLWWYLARLFRTGGFLVMMLGLLAEYVGLYRREQEKSRALEAGVADLRRADEALAAAKDQLEIRVRERTDELVQANRTLKQEIADRKRAEDLARAERQRFNDVLETLPAYVVLLTPDYHVPFANRFFRERFGESGGKRCFEYLFQRTEPCTACETYKALTTMQPHHWEWTGPDGRNYDIFDYPFADTDGSTLIMEMGIDITERKQAEAELRRHKEHLEELVKARTAEVEQRNSQLQAVLENAAEGEEALRQSEQRLNRSQEIAHLGSWELDLVNDRLSWSDEAYRIFGLLPQEFGATYEAFLERVHPDDRAAVDAAYTGSLREGRDTYEIEHRVVRKDTGQVRSVHEKCEHLRDDSGRIVRSVGMVHDITQRRQAEEAMRLAADELRRSNQDLEQFAYVASHDLQEPLRTVTGFVGLLRERYGGKLDARADEYIGMAVDGAERMSQLIRDLLAYSRVGTAGKEPRPAASEDSLRKALANLRISISEQDAGVTRDPLPVVMADATQLVQVFQNLIGNAIKFRRKDVSPQVHVGARRDGGQWVLSVSDNGIGILPDQYDRIFKVFQRLHGRHEYPGTGIGLAISKKIVERHGGRIWVESKVGEGTTFYFTLTDAGGTVA